MMLPARIRIPLAEGRAEPSDKAIDRHGERVRSAQSHPVAVLPASRRAPRATLPGPSRRITVEPLTVPVPVRTVPVPVPPAVEPSEEPRRRRDPAPAT
jgi:hypothetical protein